MLNHMKHFSVPVFELTGVPSPSNTAGGPVPGILLFLCLLCSAGLFRSCSPADPFLQEDSVTTTFCIPELAVTHGHPVKASSGMSGIRRLDLFVFNEDGLMELDSYNSMVRPSTPYVTVTSGAGDKILVVLANYDSDRLETSDFRSYEALESIRCEFKDEDPSFPVMSGECHFCAGSDGYIPIQITPVMSDICVDFIKCNFSGRGYSSTSLENACIYLTNISGSSEIMRQDGFHVNELENYGSLDRTYLSSMKHPEMVFRNVIPGHWSPYDLYCYPNDCADGAPGSPHTRLVLQGDIDGRTYYYPVEINQDGFGYTSGTRGVSRNIKYSYSLTITRKGSTDPDTLVNPEEIVEQGWIKLYPGNLLTGRIGESIHIWCETFPESAPVDICREDLDFDVERGIYEYEMDSDGHGVTLLLKDNGTGMFTIDAGPPVNDGFLVLVVVNN